MQDRFVITIGRQLGSGGHAVGELIARRLGVKLYDRELINLAAEQSGLCAELFEKADEQSKGVLPTLIGYLRSPFAGDDGTLNNPLSNDALFKVQSDVIRAVAQSESCVFVGRCADYILRDDPRRVSVFISARRADRIRRLCRNLGVASEEAEAMIDRTDSRRAAYYNYYTPWTWGAAATYELCVDSSVLGDERTADFVLSFAERKLQTKR